ncbi:S-layer homology domain-containing protein [Anoxybacterium hadale]|uniref:S-layer homology domain-containing protein n=1 Tax=Anoxybacterium hadale TaxID=3408580 RepID=UPI003AFFFF94
MKKTKRRIIAFTLVLAMVISSVSVSFAETGGNDAQTPESNGTQTQGFIDMPSNWAAEPLENAVKNGLLSGYDTAKGKEIRAGGKLTRGEMAAMINRAFGASVKGDLTGYVDVPASKWYAPEIAKAAAMGTFSGSGGKMRPEALITREEAFVALARAFKIETKKASELRSYSDAGDVSNWAIPEVSGLAAKGYVAGSNGKLAPKANITRAEFAKIMDNIVKQYITASGTVTNVENGTVVVNAPGVTLKNLTIAGDLILADGIGEGEVSLDGVAVKGNTIIRGGGPNSIVVTGNSSLGKVIISKTAGGRISVKVVGNAKAEDVIIMDGKVFLQVAEKAAITSLLVSVPDTELNIAGTVTKLISAAAASGLKLTVSKGGVVVTAALNASASVNNEGTIKTLESNASGVALSGNAPAVITGTNPPASTKTPSSSGGKSGNSDSDEEDKENLLEVSRTGYELEDYTVNFKAGNPKRIKSNILFYSTMGAVDVADVYQVLNDTEAAALVSEGRALSIGTDSDITVDLPEDLTSVNGHMFDQNEKYDFYYIYVASIPKDAKKDIVITKADLMIHPERGPAALTSIGDGPGKGAAVPAGGATSVDPESSTFVQAYIDNMKQNTPGIKPRLADFSASWQETEDLLYDDFYNNGDKENFESHGLVPVYIPLALDNYKSVANEQYFADLVESCHIAFFFGGAQLRHTRTLLNDDGTLSKVGQAIQNVLERGGTVAGSSAGSAVMSGYSYTDGANYSYPPMYWNQTELVDFEVYDGETDQEPVATMKGNSLYYKSIGVIQPAAGKDALMDSHFDIRGRLGRLLVALRDTDQTGLAIGPDEGTGIRISEQIGTVFGLGGVFIVDASDAIWSEGSGPSNPLSVTGIKLHYLTEGDTYNFDTGVVTPKSGKTEIVSPAESVYKTVDAFGPYETSKTILSLVNSEAESVTVKGKKAPDTTFAEGPTFDITYTKTAGTTAYDCSDTYGEGEIKESLGEYRKTTIVNLILDVAPGHHLPVVKAITSTSGNASILFNNPLCLGTTTDGPVDLTGGSTAKYITVKDSAGNSKALSTGSSFAISGNVLHIALASGSFEAGDTIQLTDKVMDIYGEAVNSERVFWNSGTKWSVPLKISSVYPSSKRYRTFIEFSNEIAIGYTDAADDNYFINPSSSSDFKSQYIVVKDSTGKVKKLDNANSFWLDPDYPREIMIDLDTDLFETGDTVTISTKIKDIYGEGLVKDATYRYYYDAEAEEGEWTLAL